jgi:soluble lytic murein transglycosylase-like protein
MRFARPLTVAAVALCAALAAPGQAAVYEVGEDGALIRLDVPVVATPAASRPPPAPVRVSGRAEAYRPAVTAAAARYDVSPALVNAIAHAESRFNPRAVSSAGARGIMQLMPATARQLGVDPADATANIRGGTAYLRYLLNRYDGDLVCTIAAYNAGPGHVRKSRCVPNFRETRLYVARVLDLLAGAAN